MPTGFEHEQLATAQALARNTHKLAEAIEQLTRVLQQIEQNKEGDRARAELRENLRRPRSERYDE